MISEIAMFLTGLAIVGVVYGLSSKKRGNKEMNRERLRKQS